MAFNLLGVSGSLRKASTNTALVRAAGELAGDDVTFTLADLDMPLYNGDVEDQGYPEAVTTFVDQIRAADVDGIAPFAARCLGKEFCMGDTEIIR